MFDYLQKFNKLPKDLRDKISGPKIMSAINELEKKYKIDLATIIMRVMVKDISIRNLVMYFSSEFKLGQNEATEAVKEIKNKVFFNVLDYLEGDSQKNKDNKSFFEKTVNNSAYQNVKGSNFFFSPEDEEEIRNLATKISDSGKKELSPDDINKKIRSIVLEAKINFGSEHLSSRFQQILKTYIRGIRDKIEIKQALKKPFTEGGLGFDEILIDNVLLIADKNISTKSENDFKSPPKIKLPEEIQKKDVEKNKNNRLSDLQKIGARDVDYNLAFELKKKKEEIKSNDNKEIKTENYENKNENEKKEYKIDEKINLSHRLAPPPPKLRKTNFISVRKEKTSLAKSTPIIQADSDSKMSFVDNHGSSVTTNFSHPQSRQSFFSGGIKKTENKIQKNSDIARKNENVEIKKFDTSKIKYKMRGEMSGKKRMEDVKYVPRTMNPIDELRYLDLVNFRRLSQDPFEATKKIKEKIKLLEEEQYSKRVQGIRAWKESYVNKLYLKIGQQSIENNKPVDLVIKEIKDSKQNYLDIKEFKAIMDLNRELRF